MKSRGDGRLLQMFQIELSDPAEAKAIISNNITCPQTGITFKAQEFRAPMSFILDNFTIKSHESIS